MFFRSISTCMYIIYNVKIWLIFVLITPAEFIRKIINMYFEVHSCCYYFHAFLFCKDFIKTLLNHTKILSTKLNEHVLISKLIIIVETQYQVELFINIHKSFQIVYINSKVQITMS